jgi:hypothetical protein
VRDHLRYLRTVLIHKWYVLIVGLRFGVPWGRLLVHDLSKFSRAEWGPYVAYQPYFGKPKDQVPLDIEQAFQLACAHHWAHNSHHPQYWNTVDVPWDQRVPMPFEDVLEMIVDWIAVGRARKMPDVVTWYHTHQEDYPLHTITKAEISYQLKIAEEVGLVRSVAHK